MKGLGKILFGGLLGALFGFLISPKRGQRVRDALIGKEDIAAAPSGPQLTAAPSYPPPALDIEAFRPPVAAAEPEVARAPEVAPAPAVAPAPEVAATPEVTAVAEADAADGIKERLEVVPAPGAWFESAAEAEVGLAVEPGIEESVPASIAEGLDTPPILAEAPAAMLDEASISRWETPAVDETPALVAVPEIAGQPSAGPGWAEPEPVPPTQPAESVPSPEDASGEGLEGAADLKSRIEETRRRIQRELDHPFGGESQISDEWGDEAEEAAPSPFDLPGLVSEVEVEQEAPAELASMVKEGMFAPPVPHFETESGSPEEEPDAALGMTPWAAHEPLAIGDVPDSGETPWETPFEVPAMSEAAEVLGAPLTEEAFSGGAPVFAEPATPWDIPTPVAESPSVELPAFEVAMAEEPAAAMDEPLYTAPAPEQVAPLTEEVDRLIRDEGSHEAPASPVESAVTPGEFDHEAMRRRIEETRNRLKAKAFDAMMSGETALLGRDTEEARRAATQTEVPVDREVSETIESTLTEEDF